MDGTPALQQEEAVGPKGEHLATEAQPKQAASFRESDPCNGDPTGAKLHPRPGLDAYSGTSEPHAES